MCLYGKMNTNGKCLFLIGFGAWRCQRTMQLLALPAQSEYSVYALGKCPTEAYSLSRYTYFWITNSNCPGSKKEKKKHWLSVYAMKFSSINIPTRVPGSSAIQGAQLRKNSCFPPRRQRAWEWSNLSGFTRHLLFLIQTSEFSVVGYITHGNSSYWRMWLRTKYQFQR